jgi:DMSO/TMAO reductase YedYZ molybdopterin-dependent catalytic subunit
VKNVIRIELEWELDLVGARNATVTQSDFEEALACGNHSAEFIDGEDMWSGMPLWLLVGMVDDDPDPAAPHYSFNDTLAEAGYDVSVIAYDGYSRSFNSTFVARNNDLILANQLNGEPLSGSYPLRIVGVGLAGYQKVSCVVQIELEFP